MSDPENQPKRSDPIYMTQTEASAVMELWERIQQEEAMRLSMVTVDDVAEAIQVSPEDVQRLLRLIRQEAADIKVVNLNSNRSLSLPGSDRAWAVTGLCGLVCAAILAFIWPEQFTAQVLVFISALWSIAMFGLYAVRIIEYWIVVRAARVTVRRMKVLPIAKN